MRLLTLTLGLSALLLVSPVQAEWTDIEQSFSVQPGGTLFLDTEVGGIRIDSHHSDMVEVRVEARGSDGEDFKVELTQDGNDVRIVGEKEGRSWGWSVNAMFTITVPQAYNLELRTSGGSIDIENLDGTVDATTSGGSIELGNINGDVDVETSGGSIRVEDVAGNIQAHTSGGSIKATISEQPTEDSRMTTSGGSVTAYLAEGIGVDLTAGTSGGRVKSEFDVNGTVRKQKIVGEINGGGPDLFLRTSGGSVKIKKL